MKCVILDEPGHPLRVGELPNPVPAPDEVLIRVEACGLCHSDLHLADGDWTDSLARRVRPTILGHEIVGTVAARGSSVRTIEKGDRVGVGWVAQICGRCEFCREGNENLCERRRITGVDRQGGWATRALVHVSQAVRIPDSLDPGEVAPMLCAGLTVYRGMKKAGIHPGDRVAVFGVGGLGHIAVQLAKMWRAETTAVDSREEQLELARLLGARHASLPDRAADSILSRGGVHVAIVTAAATAAYDAALRSLRKGGTLVVLGLPNDPLQIIADDIATREIRIVGSAVGTREDLRELLQLAVGEKVRCIVERVPLDQIGEALDRLRAGLVRGRIVLEP